MGSEQAILTPQEALRSKAAGRLMLFQHLKHAIPDFYSDFSFFNCILVSTSRGYPLIKNVIC